MWYRSIFKKSKFEKWAQNEEDWRIRNYLWSWKKIRTRHTEKIRQENAKERKATRQKRKSSQFPVSLENIGMRKISCRPKRRTIILMKKNKEKRKNWEGFKWIGDIKTKENRVISHQNKNQMKEIWEGREKELVLLCATVKHYFLRHSK